LSDVAWLEVCGLPYLHLARSEKSLVDQHDDPGSILLACPKDEFQIIAIDVCRSSIDRFFKERYVSLDVESKQPLISFYAMNLPPTWRELSKSLDTKKVVDLIL
jgi:hypothetical protein